MFYKLKEAKHEPEGGSRHNARAAVAIGHGIGAGLVIQGDSELVAYELAMIRRSVANMKSIGLM